METLDKINRSSGATQTCWDFDSRMLKCPPLSSDIRVDVAVIGAGITGLSCAYALLQTGKSVAVLEDGTIGSGETGRSSAHLCCYTDDYFSKLKNRFGLENSRLVADSHIQAINDFEKIIKKEAIDCDFKRVSGYLFPGSADLSLLEEEAKVLAEMGNLAFEWVDRAPFKNFDSGPSLKFPHQAQFHPIKYLHGLAKAILRDGGQIFEATHAAILKDGNPCSILTSRGPRVAATDIIVATNSPINNRLLVQTKQAQYRTYVIGVLVPKGQLEEALYWDTLQPYHYIRVLPSTDPDSDYLLIGGEDHKAGQNPTPKKAFSALLKWTAKRFPVHEIVREWSGQIIEPIDGLPFCGRNPQDNHIYIHTGDSGGGLTYAAVAASLLPQLSLGNKSALEKLYDPGRSIARAPAKFFQESGNMIAQYGDWFKPLESKAKRLSVNEGTLIRKGLSIEAVYKDAKGEVHCMSAVCPHMGGIVRWNSLEKTWDCPCHGSRFSGEGEVLNGPANSDLRKLKQ